MEYKFKIGDKVALVKDGYGSCHINVGKIVTIKDLGYYGGGPGYLIEEILPQSNNDPEHPACDGFFGEKSFEIYENINWTNDCVIFN